MADPKPGEIIREGGSVTIGAPLIKAEIRYGQIVQPEPTPSTTLAGLIRYMKGVLNSLEDLRTLLEKQEKK